MVVAWVRGSIPTGLMVLNFAVVYVANLAGAAGLAVLVWLSDYAKLGDVEATAFFRGVLCNLLVCLAVWLAMAGRSVTDKILAIVFPITAFVACGFEHCVSNMYLIPLGMLLAPAETPITPLDFGRNLLPVTLGNFFGGAGMAGLVYYLIYGWGRP